MHEKVYFQSKLRTSENKIQSVRFQEHTQE